MSISGCKNSICIGEIYQFIKRQATIESCNLAMRVIVLLYSFIVLWAVGVLKLIGSSCSVI